MDAAIERLTSLRDTIDQAPDSPGVYFFHNDRDYPLYIGKSINIQQRLLSHYYARKQDPSEANLFQQTSRISWQLTAGELGALLLEAYLIKQQQPLFNKRLRRQKRLVTLALDTDNFATIRVIPFSVATADQQQAYGLFKSRFQAQQRLRHLLKKNNLCDFTLNGFPKKMSPCFSRQLKVCCGPCDGSICKEEYNLRVRSVLEELSYITWPYHHKIAIRETSVNGQTQYHIIENWVYLQTNSEPRFDPNKALTDQLSFDKDYYLTLIRFLKNTLPEDILELG